MQTVIDQALAELKVVPVVKIDNLDQAHPLGSALAAGGLPVAEITLRTDCALEAISRFASIEGMLVGAGTVLNCDQAVAAIDAGAKFVVSPGLDEATVEFCLEKNIAIYPGCATATEVQRAYNFGLRSIKFFPAESLGGVGTLKALAAPFHQMRFVPTGGITGTNAMHYLSLECTLAVGGSWMVKPELYSGGDFESVIELTNAAVEAVNS